MTIRTPAAIFLAALLIVSLAANFLILGFAAGRYGQFRQGDFLERMIALGVRSFPAEIRREITTSLVRERPELGAALQTLQEARRRMFEIMMTEPFDRAALDAAFADVRAKTEALQERGQNLLGDAVEQSSPEARSEIRLPFGLRG
jgi:uncharacterized membrane protein